MNHPNGTFCGTGGAVGRRWGMALYRTLTDIAAPAITLYLRARRARGKEDKARFPERLGVASILRPAGPVVWCHGASVGEAMSVLSLLRALAAAFPDWSIVLTTGTVTSANLLAGRLPDRTVHQFAPVDRWPYVARFLDHWKPDFALWLESELWPNALAALRERHIPAALINARLSERSCRRWRLVPSFARAVLGTFDLILAQTQADANRLAQVGCANALCPGNLKYAADPLPCDEAALARLRGQLGGRRAWLMASTHEGEDAIALQAQARIRSTWPDVLLIAVPRHPARGQAVAALAAQQGFRAARRALTPDITPETDVYVADTMGELGLFYRLCPVTCVGGSFVWGGHNPIEPAQLGCAILFGPVMTNFAQMAQEFLDAGAALQVADASALAERLLTLLAHPEQAHALAAQAQALARRHRGVLDETLRLLTPYLSKARP